ncbi:MAG TPA: type II secretion system protein GspC [Kofleriaceae bacterium]
MHNNALHWVTAGLRRTWLVALAAVIACSVFAAHGISSLVEASYLDTAPSSPVPLHTTVQVVATPNPPDASLLVSRNMFCSTCVGSGGGPGPTDSFQPAAILIATSVGRESRATLRVPATEIQGSWGLGELVPGIGTIERIGFTSIDVADGGKRGTLTLLDGLPGGRSDAGAATPAPAAADPFADRVKKIDDTTYEVDRSLVRELVGGSVGTAGARISPVTGKDGKLTGLRLFGVRPGSVAAALGLRNGDVLQAVNNEQIESANTLLTLYSQLDKLNNVELSGTRAGKPLALMLRLR